MNGSDVSRIKVPVFAVVVIVLAAGGSAWADFTLGERTNLGPAVNSWSDEFDPCISADGLMLFFNSWYRPGGYGESDLWVATRKTTDEPWSEAVNLGPIVNSSARDEAPSISADGLSLFFSSDRPGGSGGEDLWVATRETVDDDWGEPVNLGTIVNSSASEYAPSISADGLSLFFGEPFRWTGPSSRPGGFGGGDLWVTTRPTRDAAWGTPVNLGPIVNSSSADGAPSISADGLVLFFTCGRPGYGSGDIWIAKRETVDAPWAQPTNLGPTVNSPANEADPDIATDGSTLYLSSTWPGGLGGYDIWQVTIIPIVDFNGDGKVDGFEVRKMADRWGTDESLCDIGPMPWGDGVVDVADLIVLAEYVGEGVDDPTLVTHWPLDEADGMIVSDCAGENDGLLYGDPVCLPGAGMVGGALQFDGIDDYVTTEHVVDGARFGFVLSPSDRPFSVFAWIKGGAAGQVVLSQITGVNWLMAGTVDGALMTGVKGVGRRAAALSSEAVITDGDWHRIGFTWDGSSRMLYVDDVRVAQDTQSALAGCWGGMNIGCGADMAPGTFWQGLIDDVRIYNRAVKP